MNDRRPLQAVAGLSRTDPIPGPPARRPRPVDEPGGDDARAGGAAAGDDTATAPRPATTVPEKVPARRPRATQETVRAITLSLPASLVAGVKVRARADGTTQPELLLDALSAARDQLPDLLAEAHEPPVSDGLFLRRPARAEQPEQLSTLSLRLLGPNVDTVDELVTTSGAPSRSALCAAALRYYLSHPA